MNVLEDRPTTTVPRAVADETIGNLAPLPRLAPKPRGSGANEFRRRNRFAVYFTKHGWIHALLLLSVWLFLFPFLWMLGTSVKTDDELTSASILPEIPAFRGASPYVRSLPPPQRPTDTTISRWNEMLPALTS